MILISISLSKNQDSIFPSLIIILLFSPNSKIAACINAREFEKWNWLVSIWLKWEQDLALGNRIITSQKQMPFLNFMKWLFAVKKSVFPNTYKTVIESELSNDLMLTKEIAVIYQPFLWSLEIRLYQILFELKLYKLV